MNWARLFAIASGAAFAVGLGALIAPGLFALGIEQYVVIGIGAIALLGAFQIVRLRRTGSIRYTETGNPERLPSVAAPGDELDRLLAGYEQPDSANRRRDQLRRVVIDALVRYQGLSEAEATAQVDDGTWTDDAVAASYLGTVSARSEPLTTRIRTRFSWTTAGKRTLVRTADALAAVADLPQRSNEDASLFERLRQRFDGRPTGVDRAVAVADPEEYTERDGPDNTESFQDLSPSDASVTLSEISVAHRALVIAFRPLDNGLPGPPRGRRREHRLIASHLSRWLQHGMIVIETLHQMPRRISMW